jgi:hypothetical protein
MARRDPVRIVRLYERGDLTQNEALWSLIRAAAETSPEEVAAELTSEWLLAIRSETLSPPATFEQAPRSFRLGSFIGPATYYEEERTNDLWLTFEGLWRWHRYFAGQGG